MCGERESKGEREGGRKGRSAGARKRGNRRWERERQAARGEGARKKERQGGRGKEKGEWLKGEGGVVESDRQRHTVTAKKRENNRETPTNCQVKANIFSF